MALADDRRVRKLNARDRKKDKPTNVLSYPSGERDFLGDVVLARQTVWREATRRRSRRPITSPTWSCTAPASAGLRSRDRATPMPSAWRRWSGAILAKLGIADPYVDRY